MLLGELDNRVVDLDLHGRFDAVVLEYFFQHPTVAAPDDQDIAGTPMRQNRRVREHFMVDEFILFGRLDHTVEG